ncbi:MAG TPA: Hsp20/alpha crystallin family protein [Pseudosphingobacterium sp.]|nr:Hsp20/alpha crystallin family protein [Pseudosphingobacterium sp.]
MSYRLKHPSSRTRTLILNTRENNDKYQIEIFSPGLKKEDFKISLKGNVLTISTTLHTLNIHQSGDLYTIGKFNSKSFTRVLLLPSAPANEDCIQIKDRAGSLLITIPKTKKY